MELSAVVPAAGRGRRMGRKKPKPYLILGDKPILAHTLLSLQRLSEIKEIIVVVAAADKAACQNQIVNKYRLKKVKEIVVGGNNRTQSVYRGLRQINSRYGLVLIHDGIRPFVTSDIIRKVARQAVTYGAAISAVPVISTVKEADENLIVKRTPFRNRLWLAQTPQIFQRELIQQAYYRVGNKKLIWDDAGLVEVTGRSVKLVKGERDNIKITTPQDLLLAELILKRRRKSSK